MSTSEDTDTATPSRHEDGIVCAACEDTDGPWERIDGIHLCEGCIGIADGGL
jgi:hypothetical protein